MNNIRLAYWGSGPISHFHVPALRANLIDLSSCYSRADSSRLGSFCKTFNIKKAENQSEFLLDVKKQDGVVVALETKAIPEKLGLLTDAKKIFIEKPGAASALDLRSIDERIKNKTRVLYNRRFYSTTQKLKEFVSTASGLVDFNVIFPDTREWYQTIVNVCHLFDLMMYINDDYNPEILSTFGSLNENERGYGFTIKFKHGNFLNFHNPWGACYSAQILAYDGRRTVRLQPFESFEIANEMNVIEPNENVPIRKYIPKFSQALYVDTDYKPGFYEMYKEVVKFIKGKEAVKLGTIDQAISVLDFIEQLEDALKNG